MIFDFTMRNLDFEETIAGILKRDSRYPAEAYDFIREVLSDTQKRMGRSKKRPYPQHISIKELLEGVCHFTIKEYGPMALNVLNAWGIYTCEDIGELVFNMIDEGLLFKTKEDKRDDFKAGFEFDKVLVLPFLPPSKLPKNKMESDARKVSGNPSR